MEGLDSVARPEGVEGLAVDGERVMGEDGLVYDETDAELVLSIDPDLFAE